MIHRPNNPPPLFANDRKVLDIAAVREAIDNVPEMPDAYPPAHHNAPATSHHAAASVADCAATLRARVLAFLVDRGATGATDDEGEAALGMRHQTYTPRRWELMRAGAIVDSGLRRKTTSGRGAVVWVVRE